MTHNHFKLGVKYINELIRDNRIHEVPLDLLHDILQQSEVYYRLSDIEAKELSFSKEQKEVLGG